jgi:predicted metalloendopeptidase
MNLGRAHLANGTRFDWWASPTVIGYSNSRSCITDYYINELKFITYKINNIQIQVRLAGEPFSSITLRQIGALHFAYIALKTNDQMKLFKMPGTNLTNEQTFFLAYAQTQCYQRQELSQFIRTKSGIYDERTALNTALIHMPEFAQAFQCKLKENQCFD